MIPPSASTSPNPARHTSSLQPNKLLCCFTFFITFYWYLPRTNETNLHSEKRHNGSACKWDVFSIIRIRAHAPVTMVQINYTVSLFKRHFCDVSIQCGKVCSAINFRNSCKHLEGGMAKLFTMKKPFPFTLFITFFMKISGNFRSKNSAELSVKKLISLTSESHFLVKKFLAHPHCVKFLSPFV